MKAVKIVKRYDDTELGRKVFPDEVLEVDDSRATRLVDAGVGLIIEDAESKPAKKLEAPHKAEDEKEPTAPKRARASRRRATK